MPKPKDKETIEERARDGQRNASEGNSPRPPRKFMLFADGTGNAFTTQESNVWRLYESLDRTKPDQAAYYIKGVGTAGWRPFAAFDGATGIGVPSNVRKLYRFLCWNWQPGDRVYIFGFSRGAFTARTLAALIGSQGLVPAEIDGVPVSHSEMQRNAMAAWREYRRLTVPWKSSLPTIWLARIIRDSVLAAYHFLLRHRSHADVRKAMVGRNDIEIEFLGLFDTVEAFGIPVEELRTAIDWALWPISFRNRVLSHHVKRARHALALDEERTTFRPIRFDQSNPRDADQIREVWFTGVHSDVGGGYPDGTLSYVPLVWMAEQIEHDLRFQPGSIDRFRAYQSAIGPMHDSRSGAAVMYRYGPRIIGDDTKIDGGPPVVHLAVIERMLHGCDDYAPVVLPASAKVLMPNGEALTLTEDATRKAMKTAYQASVTTQNARTAEAAEAFVKMKPPNDEMVKLALDTVWWRQFAYFSLLLMFGLLAAWPWAAKKVVAMLSGPTDKVGIGGVSVLTVIREVDYGVGAVVGPIANLIQGFLPSYAEPWSKVAVYYPFATAVIVALAVIAWRMNAYLRDRIQERARLAWNRPHRVAEAGSASGLLWIGRFMRLHGWPLRIAVTKLALPGMFLFAIFVGMLLAGGRSVFEWRMSSGAFCGDEAKADPVGDEMITAASDFEIRMLCWRSGRWVEKGRKYSIQITAQDAWFDRTIMSSVNGFRLYSPAQLAALPLRRWYAADWFQPILRIGTRGDAELPLQAINVMPADDLPRPGKPGDPKDSTKRPVSIEDTAEFQDPNSELRRNWSKIGPFDPIPSAAFPAARRVSDEQGLARLMTAEFVAPESGEVFLYINDAIQVFPFVGPFELFYQNNTGTAKVALQRLSPLTAK